MDELLGMFGSIGETENVSDIIAQFAAILVELINIITGLFKGEMPDLGGDKVTDDDVQ